MTTLTQFVAINVLLLIGSSIVTGQEVKVNSITVPSVVKNGSASVILECNYSINSEEPEKDGLVLKWYFQTEITPVYQWIAGMDPRVSGILEGRLDMGFEASENPAYLHKSIKIIMPTTELTGSYKCLVTSFDNESDSGWKKMTVFVPEREMILRTQKDAREGTVRVHCSAEGIYPEPNMTISSRERFDEDDNVRIDIETRNKDGLYNVTATMELDDRGDGNPLTFDCILRIPDANYTVHKSIIYYPSTGEYKEFFDLDLNSSSWISATSYLTLLVTLLISRL